MWVNKNCFDVIRKRNRNKSYHYPTNCYDSLCCCFLYYTVNISIEASNCPLGDRLLFVIWNVTIITQPPYPYDSVCLAGGRLYHFTHSVQHRLCMTRLGHRAVGLERSWCNYIDTNMSHNNATHFQYTGFILSRLTAITCNNIWLTIQQV